MIKHNTSVGNQHSSAHQCKYEKSCQVKIVDHRPFGECDFHFWHVRFNSFSNLAKLQIIIEGIFQSYHGCFVKGGKF